MTIWRAEQLDLQDFLIGVSCLLLCNLQKKNLALTFVRTITQLSNPSAQLYIFYCPTAHLTKVVLVLSPASKGHVGGNHKVCMTKQGTDADTLALHGVYQLQESRVQNGNQNSMLIIVDLLAFKANLGFSTKG